MEKKKTPTKRKKPKFLRSDWHKKIKLGSTVKKNRKWRGAKGRQNKIRLNRKGHPQKPKIGWGASKQTKNMVKGLEAVRVETLKELKQVKKPQGIILGRVGAKKKKLLIEEAKSRDIKIINKYHKAKPKQTPSTKK